MRAALLLALLLPLGASASPPDSSGTIPAGEWRALSFAQPSPLSVRLDMVGVGTGGGYMAFVLYDESWTLLGAYSARASSGAWAGLGSPIIPLRADVPFTQSPDGGIEIEDPVPRRYRSLLVAAGDIDGVAFRFHGAETTLLAQGDRTFYLEGHESTQTVATVQANAALYRVAVARDARIHFDVRGTFVGSIGPLGSAIHGTERVEWISPAGAATCSCWSGALNGTGMGVAGEHTILWNATSVRYFGRPILLGADVELPR